MKLSLKFFCLLLGMVSSCIGMENTEKNSSVQNLENNLKNYHYIQKFDRNSALASLQEIASQKYPQPLETTGEKLYYL